MCEDVEATIFNNPIILSKYVVNLIYLKILDISKKIVDFVCIKFLYLHCMINIIK